MTLTQLDIEKIEIIVKSTIREGTKNLPTRDDLFNWMDKIMKELQTISNLHPRQS